MTTEKIENVIVTPEIVTVTSETITETLNLKDKAAAVGLVPVIAFVETPVAKEERKRTQNAERQAKHRGKLDAKGMTQGVLPKWLEDEVKAAGGWTEWKTAKTAVIPAVPVVPQPLVSPVAPIAPVDADVAEGQYMKPVLIFMAGVVVGLWLKHFL